MASRGSLLQATSPAALNNRSRRPRSMGDRAGMLALIAAQAPGHAARLHRRRVGLGSCEDRRSCRGRPPRCSTFAEVLGRGARFQSQSPARRGFVPRILASGQTEGLRGHGQHRRIERQIDERAIPAEFVPSCDVGSFHGTSRKSRFGQLVLHRRKRWITRQAPSSRRRPAAVSRLRAPLERIPAIEDRRLQITRAQGCRRGIHSHRE